MFIAASTVLWRFHPTELVSYFATFGAGLLSGYILLWLQDRRQAAKTASRELIQASPHGTFPGCTWTGGRRSAYRFSQMAER
jgi:hypothetical protein